jgi:hypothetical protein
MEACPAIVGQAKGGLSLKEIVRRTDHSRGPIRRTLRGQRSDVFRVRETSLKLFLPWLDAQWAGRPAPRRYDGQAFVHFEQIDVHASDQICALPPSTNSSMPVTKLESSEARNSAALAISSGEPMRPIGMVDTILAIASGG